MRIRHAPTMRAVDDFADAHGATIYGFRLPRGAVLTIAIPDEEAGCDALIHCKGHWANDSPGGKAAGLEAFIANFIGGHGSRG